MIRTLLLGLAGVALGCLALAFGVHAVLDYGYSHISIGGTR